MVRDSQTAAGGVQDGLRKRVGRLTPKSASPGSVPGASNGDTVNSGVMVAIPAHNEEVGIGSVVLRAREHAREVVVVDDGSTDSTARVAEAAGARVVRHEQNGGYGAALATIFRVAREEGWPNVVILDSDGQHNPSDIPLVAEPIVQGEADVSIGSRFTEDVSREGIPVYRRFGIRVLTALNNVGATREQRVKDGQSGFRAYSRRAIEAIEARDHDMGASAEIIFQARRAGCTFTEVPIHVRYDVDGSSQNPVKHGMGVISAIVRYVELEHPLLSFALPGMLMLITGLLAATFGVSTYLASGTVPVVALAGGTALSVLGILCTLTGLILHAVVTAARER